MRESTATMNDDGTATIRLFGETRVFDVEPNSDDGLFYTTVNKVGFSKCRYGKKLYPVKIVLMNFLGTWCVLYGDISYDINGRHTYLTTW